MDEINCRESIIIMSPGMKNVSECCAGAATITSVVCMHQRSEKFLTIDPTQKVNGVYAYRG